VDEPTGTAVSWRPTVDDHLQVVYYQPITGDEV
jgi:hypothetical protein